MPLKGLHFLLLLTSLFGYLEWGTNNHSFLFEAEWEMLTKLVINPLAVAHPFTLLPLLGQLLLLITLFQKVPSKRLTYIGMLCLGLLLGMMTMAGLIGMNGRIVISTLPFWVVVLLIFRHFKKK